MPKKIGCNYDRNIFNQLQEALERVEKLEKELSDKRRK